MAMELAEPAQPAVQQEHGAHAGGSHAGTAGATETQPEQPMMLQHLDAGDSYKKDMTLAQGNAHLMLLAMADASAAAAAGQRHEGVPGMDGGQAYQGDAAGGDQGAQQPDTGGMTDDGEDDSDMDADMRPQSGRPKQVRKKKPHLQGRFSGRLATKDDEKRLAEECRAIAPLVGGVGKRGDRSMLTLAKIVRGIATGTVRRFLEGKEASHRMLLQQLETMQVSGNGKVLREMQKQVDTLRRELDAKNRRIAQLEASQPQSQQHNASLAAAAAAAAGAQQQLVLLQAAGQGAAGLYSMPGMPGMLTGPGQAMVMDNALQELRALEQQLNQLQTELLDHQQQSTQAAQNHSTALSRTQALHAEVRALAVAQKEADPAKQSEANAAIRELSLAAQSEEKKVQLHFQTHHHHRAQVEALRRDVDNTTRRMQQLQASLQQQQQQQQQQPQAQLQQLNMGGQEVLFTLAPAGARGQMGNTLLLDGLMGDTEGPIVTIDDHQKHGQMDGQLHRPGAFLQVPGAGGLTAQGLAGGLATGSLAAAQSLASLQRPQFVTQQISPFQQTVAGQFQMLPGMPGVLPGMKVDGTMS